MTLFGKKTEGGQEKSKADIEAISSLIDKSMSITGTLTFKGKARIDGIVSGNIEGEHLILSETGRIIGNIKSISFNCYGTLEGDVQANNVIARKNCSIHGRLEAISLTVEPGAAIDGEIKAATKDLRQIDDKNQSQAPTFSKAPVLHKAHG
ncbi:MAG: polymer-forming cytoskeletal protein [Desulfoprunum sp.]|nr:polymer-forming cytoskeletal protein [Desulfoprunum sp.]